MIINILFKTILDIILGLYLTLSDLLAFISWDQPDLSVIGTLYGNAQYFFNSGTITLVVGLILGSVPTILVFALVRFIYQKIPGVQ